MPVGGSVARGWGNDWRDWKPGWESTPPRHTAPRATASPKRVDVAWNAIAFQCRCLGLPEPVAEFRFHPERKWRFDVAWPDLKVALEQEGIVYPQKGDHKLDGRHTSVAGFTADIEKYGEAFKLGWRVLRCLPSQVTDGTAMIWLEDQLRHGTLPTAQG